MELSGASCEQQTWRSYIKLPGLGRISASCSLAEISRLTSQHFNQQMIFYDGIYAGWYPCHKWMFSFNLVVPIGLWSQLPLHYFFHKRNGEKRPLKNPLFIFFLLEKPEYALIFYIIHWHWNGASCWMSNSKNTRFCLHFKSISRFLMFWWCKMPGHQKAWYWADSHWTIVHMRRDTPYNSFTKFVAPCSHTGKGEYQ